MRLKQHIRQFFFICAAAALLALLNPIAVFAQEKMYAFDIPAQDLSSALRAFAHVAHQQVTFEDKTVQGKHNAPVQGTYTPRIALDLLIGDSGLTVHTGKSGLFIVREPASAAAATGNIANLPPLRLAQDTGSNAVQTTLEDPDDLPDVPAAKGIPEILVKGSRSLNMGIRRTRDDALPYVIFDREQIEKSGASDLNEFLKNTLTMSATNSSNAQIAGLGSTSAIDLRGLGTNQTLILLDGHRTSSISRGSVVDQPDLNGVPLSAVERIEVLPTSASGIYGGSATGGAINVVLRRDYSGMQTRVGYDGTFQGGGSRRRADISAGFNLEGGRTSILLAGSYSSSNPLLAQDRELVQQGRARTLNRDPQKIRDAYQPLLGSTTNICSADPFGAGACAAYYGVDIPLTLKDGTALGSSITSVPPGYGGVDSDDGALLVTQAGQYNLALSDTAQTGGGRSSLLNDPTVQSLTATVRRQFTSRIDGFLELSTSKNAGHTFQNDYGTFLVPESAPSNPFGQDVVVTTPAFGADSAYESSVRHRRALIGAIVQLPASWQGELDYTWDRTRNSASNPAPYLDVAALAAVASGAIDVFRDINGSRPDFSPYRDSEPRAILTPGDATLQDATLRLSGPLGISLPGGAMVLSGLLEHRRESLSRSAFTGTAGAQIFPSRWQTVDSAYLETRLPLIGADNALRGVRELEMTVALRHDRYETVGANQLVDPDDPVQRATNRLSSTDPTLSLRLRPTIDVQLRASYGTGFLPPAVNQIVPRLSTIDLTGYVPFGYVDPRRGNGPIGEGLITLIGGGSPDLKPEESESWSAGIVLTPRFAPGLRASVDWVRIEKTDNIASPFFLGGTPSVFDFEEQIPGLVVRGPASGGYEAGPVLALANQLLVNIAEQKVEALDFGLEYRLDTASLGTWGLSSAATRQLHNKTRIIPGSELEERTGESGGGLKLKTNATLDWEMRQWTLAWTATFFDEYTVTDFNTGADSTVGRQVYHDAFARYRPDADGRRWMSGVELQLGIQNVFDKTPPFDSSNTFSYYSLFGDPRMRRYSLSATVSF